MALRYGKRAAVVLVAAGLALAMAACGNDDDEPTVSGSGTTVAPAVTTTVAAVTTTAPAASTAARPVTPSRRAPSIRESGRRMGEVLAGAVNLLNPAALVLAGDMAKAYDILVAGLRETVFGNASTLATRELQILPSTHGDRAGVIGCAAMILDHVLSAGAIDAAPMT